MDRALVGGIAGLALFLAAGGCWGPAGRERVGRPSGPPLIPAPSIRAPPTPTTAPAVDLAGYAQAGLFVDVYVNGVEVGTTVADASGQWTLRRVPLEPGRNLIAVVARDDHGNRSEGRPIGRGPRLGSASITRPEVVVERR